jgi:hypothetical protein
MAKYLKICTEVGKKCIQGEAGGYSNCFYEAGTFQRINYTCAVCGGDMYYDRAGFANDANPEVYSHTTDFGEKNRLRSLAKEKKIDLRLLGVPICRADFRIVKSCNDCEKSPTKDVKFSYGFNFYNQVYCYVNKIDFCLADVTNDINN